MKYFVIAGAVLLLAMFFISPAYASFTDSVLVQVSGEFKKVYYNEKNVNSVLFDPTSASVIFETGNNATLEIKAPKIYETGPNLFILKNGEEVAPKIKSEDDCFYYVTIEASAPETIEIAFTYWPEYLETVENCETFGPVAPLKQTSLGIPFDDIRCKGNLALIQKYDGSPVCAKEQTAAKLTNKEQRSGWNASDQLWKHLSKNMYELSSDDSCPKYCIIMDEKYVVGGIDQTLGGETGLPKFLPDGYDYFQYHHRDISSVIQISTNPVSLNTLWTDFYWKDNGIFLRFSEFPVTADGDAQIAYWAKNNNAQKLDLTARDEPVYIKEREIFYGDKIGMLYPTFTEAQFNYEDMTITMTGYISGKEMFQIVDSFFEK